MQGAPDTGHDREQELNSSVSRPIIRAKMTVLILVRRRPRERFDTTDTTDTRGNRRGHYNVHATLHALSASYEILLTFRPIGTTEQCK